MSDYDGQICHDCESPFTEVFDFLVSTAVWNFVMAGQEQTTYTIRKGLYDQKLAPRVEGVAGVVCLACFDKRARKVGFDYSDYVTILGIDCWMGGKDIPASVLAKERP